MTRTELSALEVLIGEFRDFRQQDSEWKSRQDDRTRKLEEFVAGEQAIDEREQERGVNRRALIASVIAAVGVTCSFVLGVVNLLRA